MTDLFENLGKKLDEYLTEKVLKKSTNKFENLREYLLILLKENPGYHSRPTVYSPLYIEAILGNVILIKESHCDDSFTRAYYSNFTFTNEHYKQTIDSLKLKHKWFS